MDDAAGMKVIQIGLGEFGHGWFADILAPHKRLEVIALVDTDQGALAKALANTGIGIPTFRNLADALDTHQPDFIVNVTPPSVHAGINLVAIHRKIPVLCEKPIAESPEDVDLIVRSADANRVPVMIAENYRYSKIIREAKTVLKAGLIGPLVNLQCSFRRKHWMDNYHKYLKHPLLMDVTIHHLDLVRYLTGSEAASVSARSWTPGTSRYSGYSDLELWIEMNDGVKVSYQGSLSSAKKEETDWLGDWRLEGEKGILTLSRGRLTIESDTLSESKSILEDRDSRIAVVSEFIASLEEGRPAETDLHDNLKTFAIARNVMEIIEKRSKR